MLAEQPSKNKKGNQVAEQFVSKDQEKVNAYN